MPTVVKKLVLAPHIDDDVLGCGGILDSTSAVLYCGVEDFHVVSKSDRLAEAAAASKILGHSWELLEGNTVNRYQLQDLLDVFSSKINELKPDEVFIPHPSYNQDHRTVYNAAITALRPHDHNHFVNRVLVYEQPHVAFWDHAYSGGSHFKPNYFVPIDVERKVLAYKAMISQVRSFRSEDHVRALAKLRGGQCNVPYAEAFNALRIMAG